MTYASPGGRPQTPRRRRGFSLIELLLVLVILSVLAGVVATNFVGRTEQAKETAAKTQIETFKVALRAFEVDIGRYPNNSEGLRALVEQPPGLEKWKRTLDSDAVPKDPWGNEYTYKQPGQHHPDGYDLYSAGPDGQPDTDDDVTNWTK